MQHKAIAYEFWRKLQKHNFDCDLSAIKLDDACFPVVAMPFYNWFVELMDLGNSLGVTIITPSCEVKNLTYSWNAHDFEIFNSLFDALTTMKTLESIK